MKFRNLAIAVVMGIGFCAPASANSLTFEGVTFETLALDSNTLQLTIDNVLSGPSGTDNWLNVAYLSAFEIKDIGTVTSATLDSWTGVNLAAWTTTIDSGLASVSVGCVTGGTPGACFYGTPAAMSNHMVITMSFGGSGLTFDSPSLKVNFLENSDDSKPTGDHLSRTIPSAVPEPEIYAMMSIGLGLMGWIGRRRKMQAD
jgi:hypothetical protein